MSLIPALIAQGVTGADASQPVLPLTAYDQAVAALSVRPAALKSAYWGGRQIGGNPLDRLTGSAIGNVTGVAPVLVASDGGFPTTMPSGAVVNAPSHDFSANSNAAWRERVGSATTASFSIAMVWLPPTPEATGVLAIVGSGPYGPGVSLSAADLRLTLPYGSTVQTLTRTGKVREDAANLIVVCGDAATRQIATYLNSKTPEITPTGVGPSPWPVLSGNSSKWGYANSGGNNTACPIRVAQVATFDRSLHHDARCQSKLQALIQAAADTYGIPLA
ncbi:hypothetical protein QOZ96_002465 [Brevundimonas nasdae]|uniref:hypothetical protein n=1 Tax=Brevundimonas nasdae TaxID=172043 RepID=UPI001913334D|nr:hypothetical protein [Brevundimonas nasdae]MBK6026041.1 hypothetical protein [Brevundimonas nasdae]MDQ0452512.1 hypothetical protein [Brevundimonas nasdae]